MCATLLVAMNVAPVWILAQWKTCQRYQCGPTLGLVHVRGRLHHLCYLSQFARLHLKNSTVETLSTVAKWESTETWRVPHCCGWFQKITLETKVTLMTNWQHHTVHSSYSAWSQEKVLPSAVLRGLCCSTHGWMHTHGPTPKGPTPCYCYLGL